MYSIFWLLLLSIIVLTFLRVVACSLLVYFYSRLVYPLYGHTAVCLRIHLLMDVWDQGAEVSFAFSLSHLQGLSQWVNSLHQVARVLELQPQPQSFQSLPGLFSFRIDWFHLLRDLSYVDIRTLEVSSRPFRCFILAHLFSISSSLFCPSDASFSLIFSPSLPPSFESVFSSEFHLG